MRNLLLLIGLSAVVCGCDRDPTPGPPTVEPLFEGAPSARGLAGGTDFRSASILPEAGFVLARANRGNYMVDLASGTVGEPWGPFVSVDPTGTWATEGFDYRDERLPTIRSLRVGSAFEMPTGTSSLSIVAESDGEVWGVFTLPTSAKDPRMSSWYYFVRDGTEFTKRTLPEEVGKPSLATGALWTQSRSCAVQRSTRAREVTCEVKLYEPLIIKDLVTIADRYLIVPLVPDSSSLPRRQPGGLQPITLFDALQRAEVDLEGCANPALAAFTGAGTGAVALYCDEGSGYWTPGSGFVETTRGTKPVRDSGRVGRFLPLGDAQGESSVQRYYDARTDRVIRGPFGLQSATWEGFGYADGHALHGDTGQRIDLGLTRPAGAPAGTDSCEWEATSILGHRALISCIHHGFAANDAPSLSLIPVAYARSPARVTRVDATVLADLGTGETFALQRGKAIGLTSEGVVVVLGSERPQHAGSDGTTLVLQPFPGASVQQ